jgi:tetratricopeptide (TPR) repeat protein
MRHAISVSLAVACLLLLSLFLVPGPAARAELKDDGRVGKVIDLQGTALLSPAGHDRWTPLNQRDLVMPGDRVRTMPRGANAVELRLTGGGAFVLGPGGLLEVGQSGDIRLLTGEMEFVESTGASPKWVRAKDGELTALDAAPRWLTGYRASTTNEWMGSLVAEVDGRNVALSIGYHKVEVVVKDQIAETTVEESFVNETDATLEGAFTFPLPADASISGFGMWIGDELVMADIVERGRAREIYEDILKRRKDPGLLEWSGGNLFKARVFPIFPHSEKRVKVRYTQVLPLTGTKLRYTYALRSEMLRAHPLRALSVGVSVDSTLPIAAVSTPSHETTIHSTGHEVRVDYDAAEVTPERDFELILDLESVAPLTVVPHRRGPDGYFLLLLSPPDAGAAGWQRELAPEGDPVDLVLVADTSGSMDAAQRAAQAAFVESLLSLLGPKDTFLLGTTDPALPWYTDAAVGTPQAVAGALDFLAAQDSLGWTDLDALLAAAAERAGPKTHVVYVGDGIGTEGDPDPSDLIRRIGKFAETARGTFHAVSTGSSYDAGVLAALAGIGGGSVREGASDPAGAAYRLLSEVARPAVKDLAVSFSGLKTARVYPERLPNLPAGAQQAILGRFLPEGGEAKGEVVVTGTLGGKPVKFTAPFALAAGETGNEFLPRLWARRHVDALLREGRTPEVKEQIVSFSAEFGIMTPLTSFLVLESDADREQYGVTRRVAMRDGEAMFATAKDKVSTGILEQAMRAAGTWRKGLRARVLAEIADLGRSLVPAGVAWGIGIGGGAGAFLGYSGPSSGPDAPEGGATESRKSLDGRGDGEWEGEELGLKDAKPGDHNESDEDLPGEESERLAGEDGAGDAPMEPMEKAKSLEMRDRESNYERDGFAASRENLRKRQAGRAGDRRSLRSELAPRAPRRPEGDAYEFASRLGLFPWVPPVPEEPKPAPDQGWPEEVKQILSSLDRTADADAFAGGLVIVLQSSGSPHPIRDEWRSVSRMSACYAGGDWVLAREHRGQAVEQYWCRGGERAAVRPDLGLGRKRPASEMDRKLRFSGIGLDLFDFARRFPDCDAQIVSREGDVVTLRFARRDVKSENTLVVDVKRRVPLSQRVLDDGKETLILEWSEWTEIGGLPFAGRLEQKDADGKVAFRTITEVQAHPADLVGKAIEDAVGLSADSLFLPAVDPAIAAAKKAADEGTAKFEDRYALMMDYAARGRFDEALAECAKAKALVPGKPGADIVEAALLSVARRGEALQKLLTQLAAGVAARLDEVRAGLAEKLFDLGQGTLGGNEILALARTLRAAQPDEGDDAPFVARRWDRRIAGLLENVGHRDEALALRETLVVEAPDDPELRRELVDALVNLGRTDDALAAAEAALQGEGRWTDEESWSVHQRRTDLLWGARRLPEFLAAVDLWLARKPASEDVFERKLVGLLFSGKIEDLDAAILRELAEGPGDSPKPADHARFAAAADVALGSAWNLWANRIHEPYVKPLGEAALRLARRPDDAGNQAGRILGNWRFQNQDEYRRVIAELRTDLFSARTLAEMSPERLARTANWFDLGRGGTSDAEFAVLVREVEARLGSAQHPADRAWFAEILLAFYDRRDDARAAADLLRRRLASEPAETRHAVVAALVERLCRLPWTEETEDEVLSHLPALLPPGTPEPLRPEDESRFYAAAARYVADRLLAARVEALLGPAAEREKLPRAELNVKTKASRKAAREALSARLRDAVAGAPERLAPWLTIEALDFAVEALLDPPALEGQARELLLSPPAIPAPEYVSVFEERAALVLEYLATRRGAAAELTDRVLALVKERAFSADEENREDRRYRVFRLLLALDRPDELVTLLKAWAGTGRIDGFYRTALAYLLAERGALAEAAAELEAIAKADELPAAGFTTLATWYLALGDDARRGSALERALVETPEWELSQRIWQERSRVERPGPDGVPGTFDPEVFRVEKVLLSKASQPGNYVHVIRSLYEPTKDFRALAALADGIIGHSPEAIYPYLTQVWNALSNVHEEATLDQVAARIDECVAAASTASNRRGLRYLAALVYRRAAEVKNRPEVHAEEALPALKGAFPTEWLPGEPRLLAAFLVSLGAIPDAALAAEHLRQLAAIHAAADPATEDGLAIGADHASARWAYGRHDEAIDTLTTALDAFRAASGGKLPAAAFGRCGTLVSWYESRERFAAGEEWLKKERERQAGAGEKAWFTLRLLSLHANALRAGGRTSLGEGEALFEAAFDLTEQSLPVLPAGSVDEGLRVPCQLVGAMPRAAQADHLAAFMRERSRPHLDRVPDAEQNLWLSMAAAVHHAKRPEVGLALLVEKLEMDPAWYPRVSRDGWRQFASTLARWRFEQKTAGELADRLAKIVVESLVDDLRTGERYGWTFYHDDSAVFWKERAAEFAAAARRVIEVHADSPSTILRAAGYLWDGLSLGSEAVDALADLDGRGKLPDDGRLRLALWLMDLKRHAEAIPHLKQLLAKNANRLDVRCPLIVCFHETGADTEGKALADETDKMLTEHNHRNADGLVPLAEACFACGYHDRAARLYEEAIRFVERLGRRGYEGLLAGYYGRLGRSLAALGRGEEAVDAATAAVVVWGNNYDQRKEALGDLVKTLDGLLDFDGYVAGYAKKAAETGLDAPVLRKSFGIVYMTRKDYAKAAEALKVARELSPMDRDIHQLLVKCGDLSGDAAAALKALSESLRYAPADLALMADLAARYDHAGRADDAERVRTNYVEPEPMEAAGHAQLAAEREKAQRFDEAIAQRRLAVKMRAFDPEVWFALVSTLKAAGKADEAKAVLEEMMARPWSAEAGDVRKRITDALR